MSFTAEPRRPHQSFEDSGKQHCERRSAASSPRKRSPLKRTLLIRAGTDRNANGQVGACRLDTCRLRRIPRARLIVDLRAEPYERNTRGHHEELKELVAPDNAPSAAQSPAGTARTEEAPALIMGGNEVDH